MKFDLPKRIRHSKDGFEVLACLHAQTERCFMDDVEIDMASTDWFDADMCAVLGGILYRLGGRSNLNTVALTNICSEVETILARNGFLSHYGREKLPDRWGTTISYKRFDVEDSSYFARYVEDEFIQQREMREMLGMSPGLQKKFHEAIFEIFSNAVSHSHTEMGIFSCGQFYPARHQLNFTVADMGVGMRRKIQDHLGRNLSPEEAIVWATERNHTTRKGGIPGGLGLKLLREFIDRNDDGCLQIVSDAGYWRREKQGTCTERLSCPFPGTVVNVEINTADQNTYGLSSEATTNDIF